MDLRELFKNLKKEAECPLCLDTLNDPKTLPCLHSFCLVCIDKHAHFARRQLQTTISCPVCLTCFQIPEGNTFAGLPASFHLNRLVDVLALGHDKANAQKCVSCEAENKATCYCFDCHDFFCWDCLRLHDRMPLSRRHRNVLIENLQAQDVEELIHRPVMCTEKYHEKEALEYYCQECKVCICIKCGFVNHDRHVKMDIEQAAEEQKMQLMDAMEKMKAKILSCEKLMTQTNESFAKKKEEIFIAQKEVRETVEELVAGLKEHETAVMTKLNDIYEALKKDNATQQKNFELFATQLRSSVEYCEAIVGRNIRAAILQTKDSIVRRCKELLSAEPVIHLNTQRVEYVRANQDIADIKGSVPGHVYVGRSEPSQTMVYGEGLKTAEVGRESCFRVETKDFDGNLSYHKDDCVTVKIHSPIGEELERDIQDSKNGKYTITYSPHRAGQHDVVITVNGKRLSGCPWRVQVTAYVYHALFSFGTQGTGKGQFESPRDVAVSKRTGNIAVADVPNKRIQIFSSGGRYITEFGQSGPVAQRLGYPNSAAFTKSGDVIVSHYKVDSPKLLLFSESGQFVRNITDKHLNGPMALSVGSDGQLIVCDGDDTIKVLSPDGTELLQSFYAQDCAGEPSCAVCHQDKFFVSYYSAGVVKVFNKQGAFLYNIGSKGTGNGQFDGPIGLHIDDEHRYLIVCDSGNKRLQIFTEDGKFVNKIEGKDINLGRPYRVALSNQGNMFVTDTGKHCVHVFQRTVITYHHTGCIQSSDPVGDWKCCGTLTC